MLRIAVAYECLLKFKHCSQIKDNDEKRLISMLSLPRIIDNCLYLISIHHPPASLLPVSYIIVSYKLNTHFPSCFLITGRSTEDFSSPVRRLLECRWQDAKLILLHYCVVILLSPAAPEGFVGLNPRPLAGAGPSDAYCVFHCQHKCISKGFWEQMSSTARHESQCRNLVLEALISGWGGANSAVCHSWQRKLSQGFGFPPRNPESNNVTYLLPYKRTTEHTSRAEGTIAEVWPQMFYTEVPLFFFPQKYFPWGIIYPGFLQNAWKCWWLVCSDVLMLPVLQIQPPNKGGIMGSLD